MCGLRSHGLLARSRLRVSASLGGGHRRCSTQERAPNNHEAYIKLSLPTLLQALHDDIGGRASGSNKDAYDHDFTEQWTQFVSMAEVMYHHRAHLLGKKLVDTYEFFRPSWGEQERKNSGMRPADLRRKEQDFLNDFLWVLDKANFLFLSQAEWQFACTASHLFSHPLEVGWGFSEDKLFTRFLTNPLNQLKSVCNKKAYCHRDRIWMFRRGTSLQEFYGTHQMRKWLLLKGRLIAWFGENVCHCNLMGRMCRNCGRLLCCRFLTWVLTPLWKVRSPLLQRVPSLRAHHLTVAALTPLPLGRPPGTLRASSSSLASTTRSSCSSDTAPPTGTGLWTRSRAWRRTS